MTFKLFMLLVIAIYFIYKGFYYKKNKGKVRVLGLFIIEDINTYMRFISKLSFFMGGCLLIFVIEILKYNNFTISILIFFLGYIYFMARFFKLVKFKKED